MKDVLVPVPRLRTTALTAPLRTYGVVTGMGSLLNEALEDLVKHAQEAGAVISLRGRELLVAPGSRA